MEIINIKRAVDFMSLRLMNIQNFSAHDGNGIRSTVFLAGCPLRCEWCANPEGVTSESKIAYYKESCTGCGKCQAVCPQNIDIELNKANNRYKCIACGKCANICPSGARKKMVTSTNITEIVDAVKPYIGYFRTSDGGVTFSGGEPTSQLKEFSLLAKSFYDMGINLALETCAFFDFEKLRNTLMLFETIFVDLKVMDTDTHLKYTGVRNDIVLENIKKLSELPLKIVIRVPLIQGINDTEKNIDETAVFVKKYAPKAEVELLPYHNFGDIKYKALGMELPNREFKAPERSKVDKLLRIIMEHGLTVATYSQ